MRADEFDELVKMQFRICEAMLVDKAQEYATADRLHNFKTAATVQGITPRQALAGMMAKHTVSLYDMCMSTQSFPLGKWDEKITDHINYLILLRAIIQEKDNKPPIHILSQGKQTTIESLLSDIEKDV